MLSFLKSKNLRWSDLAFVIGVLLSVPIIIESVIQMNVLNPVESMVPFGLTIALSILIIISYGTCLFFEFKVYKSPVHLIPLAASVLLILIGCLVMFLQPETITITYPDINGEALELGAAVSGQVRFVYFMCYFTTISMVYIVVFLLSYRIKNINFLIFFVNILTLICLFGILFSLISEFQQYGRLIQHIFSGDESAPIKDYAIKSFMNHRNIYGALLEFTILSLMVSYIFTKRKINFIFIGLFYFEMLFTLCKTGLLITGASLIIWAAFLILRNNKNDKKKFYIWLAGIIGTIVVLISVSLTLFFTVPAVNEKVIYFFEGGGTMVGRIKIWKKASSILKDSLVFGRGFGLFNSILFVVNSLVLSDPTFSVHSMFLSIIGRSGIIGLIAFLALMVYTVKCVIDILKKNPTLGVTFLIAFTGIFIHCLFEDHYYVLFVVSFFVLTTKHSYFPKDEKRLSLI